MYVVTRHVSYNAHLTLEDGDPPHTNDSNSLLCFPECAHLLLAHNAPVKVKNAQGWSPLAEAISYGDRQMSMLPSEPYIRALFLDNHIVALNNLNICDSVSDCTKNERFYNRFYNSSCTPSVYYWKFDCSFDLSYCILIEGTSSVFKRGIHWFPERNRRKEAESIQCAELSDMSSQWCRCWI